MENKILRITSAEYISGYVLRLTFNNGEVRDFDFAKIFDKGILVKLQDKSYFLNFRLDPYTVDWNNEIGIAPEYLYEKGAKVA